MTALLYYSMSSDLTVDEIIEIDRQIAKSRKTVCFFVTNLASNAKDKTRKGIVVIILGGALYFNSVQPAEAISLPAQVVKVQPSYQHDSNVQIAKEILRKKEVISPLKKYYF